MVTLLRKGRAIKSKLKSTGVPRPVNNNPPLRPLPFHIAGNLGTMPEMPPVKVTWKNQPWHRWKCNWKQGRKQCKMVIEGPNPGPVDRSSDQHWQKHIREFNHSVDSQPISKVF